LTCPSVRILDLLLTDVLLERKLGQHVGRWVDQRVVLDRFRDERLGGLVGAAVVDEVRERGADLGLEDVVHELLGVLGVRRALRDRH
jgi:hypothetical protein